jgi:hypothetical protein
LNCLCYCVFRHPGPEVSGSPPGVAGHPVYQISHRRLSTAVSLIAGNELTPDLPRVKAYEGVVHSYHQRGAVIPLRYGCVAAGESQVIQLLDEYSSHYESLLEELEDCVEMGLRVLLPSVSWAAVTPGRPASCREVPGPQPQAPETATDRLGLTYLTARKAHYAHQDRWTNEYRQAADRYLSHFHGLFTKSKLEGPTPRLPLLSLYFLVHRAAVDSFRQTFRRLAATDPARLLLSGPWPPYNFVTSNPNPLSFPRFETPR